MVSLLWLPMRFTRVARILFCLQAAKCCLSVSIGVLKKDDPRYRLARANELVIAMILSETRIFPLLRSHQLFCAWVQTVRAVALGIEASMSK